MQEVHNQRTRVTIEIGITYTIVVVAMKHFLNNGVVP
jgi:hypothetical protein